MLASNAELGRKLAALENKYDAQFKVVFDAIRQLMSPPAKPKREIGFHVKYDDDKPKSSHPIPQHRPASILFRRGKRGGRFRS
jgi:hypothetical protein